MEIAFAAKLLKSLTDEEKADLAQQEKNDKELLAAVKAKDLKRITRMLLNPVVGFGQEEKREATKVETSCIVKAGNLAAREYDGNQSYLILEKLVEELLIRTDVPPIVPRPGSAGIGKRTSRSSFRIKNLEQHFLDIWLKVACEHKVDQFTPGLLEKGANKSWSDPYTGLSMFGQACFGGDLAAVQAILNTGAADARAPVDPHGWTGIQLATYQGNIEVMKFIYSVVLQDETVLTEENPAGFSVISIIQSGHDPKTKVLFAAALGLDENRVL